MLWCHVVSTHIVHIVCMFAMHWYVWDSTPSCVPWVVLHTRKCLFVLPPSLGSLLLLRTHWLTGMYPSWLLCLSPRGNVTRCNGVPVACYDSSTLADDRHLPCWVMYACPCTDVPLGFITSHVHPGSLTYDCWQHSHIREHKGTNGPSQGKVAAMVIVVREAAKWCDVLQAGFFYDFILHCCWFDRLPVHLFC